VRASRKRLGTFVPESALLPSLCGDPNVLEACRALGKRSAIIWQTIVANLFRSDRAVLGGDDDFFRSAWLSSVVAGIAGRFKDVDPDSVTALADRLLTRFLRPGPVQIPREIPAEFRAQ